MSSLRNLIRYRELLACLIAREYTAYYKQSLLGPSWAVIQPVTLTLLFCLVRLFIKIPSDGKPYLVFAFSAVVPWTLLSSAVTFAAPSIVSNAGIVRKIYFPREVFPAAAVLTRLLDFAACFVLLLATLLWCHIWPGAAMLALAPLILIEMMLAFGVALMASALGAFRRDVVVAVPILMQFWMYASPVIYSLSAVPPRMRRIYLLNPMAGVIDGFRRILLDRQLPELTPTLCAAASAFIMLAAGHFVFKRLEMHFADVV